MSYSELILSLIRYQRLSESKSESESDFSPTCG